MTAALYLPAANARVLALRGVLQGRNSKGVKESALRELRALEDKRGLDNTYPNGYNKP